MELRGAYRSDRQNVTSGDIRELESSQIAHVLIRSCLGALFLVAAAVLSPSSSQA